MFLRFKLTIMNGLKLEKYVESRELNIYAVDEKMLRIS